MNKYISTFEIGESEYKLKDSEVRTDLGAHEENTDIHVTAAEKEYWNSKVNPPSYSAPTAKTLTYTGEAQDLLNPGSSTSGSIQYSTDEVNWSTTIPQATNAGTYTVYWKFAGSEIVYVDSTAINVTIAKANPTYTAPTGKSGLVYNASAQELLNAGSSSNGTISYSEDNENWGSSIPQETNANSYTVYWKLTGDANHNDVASTAINVNIAKVTPTITAPTAKSLTYNAQSQELLNTGSTNWGTLKYSDNGEIYGITIPSATNAGTYTLYYKVEGDSNINDTTPVEISVTIAKLTPTVVAPTAKTGLVYTGSAQTLVNAGSTDYGTLKYSLDDSTYSTSIPSGTNVTSYDVWYKVIGDSNIDDVAPVKITVSIAKANPTYTAPTARTLTYDGNAQELVNAGTTSDGTILYSEDNDNWSSIVPSKTNADTYTIYWKLEVNDSEHYNDVTGTVGVTVAKVTPTVTAPTAKTLTYSGSAQELVNAGSTDFGTLQYSLDNEIYSTSIPSGTNAGSYTVYYKVVGDNNVNDVAAQNVSASIKINRNVKFYNDNGRSDYIEIGGILWATKNIGANNVTDAGLYFQWGDAKGYTASQVGSGSGLKYFSWSDYKYCNGTSSVITKYNSSDGKTVLESSDDAARANWGGSWKMPTYDEMQSLVNSTTNTWTSNYQNSGVAGRVFTDKTDSSKVLFFPAASSASSGSVSNVGTYGDYFLGSRSSTSNDTHSNYVFFNSSYVNVANSQRHYGYTVRGIIESSIKTVLDIGLTNTIIVKTEGNPTITVTSSNTSVATVSGMTVTAVNWGNTTITITIAADDTYNEYTYSYVMSVYDPYHGGQEWVDLGLPSGRKWARGNLVSKEGGGCKIGSELEYGGYFSWGNVAPHFSSNGYLFDDGYTFTQDTYNSTSGASLTANIASNDAAHDAALALLGSPWRMATKDEFVELINNTDNVWTKIKDVAGVKFMKKSDHTVYIFFPAGGWGGKAYGSYGEITSLGTYTLYWSSSYGSDNSRACAMYGYTNSSGRMYINWSNDNRWKGMLVRAVQ